MTKILTVSKNISFAQNISSFLSEYNFENYYYIYTNDDETLQYIKENNFSAVMIDDEIETYSVLSKRIKNIENENIFVAIFYNQNSIMNSTEDFTGFVDTFIQKPIQKNILIPIISSYLKIKKSVDKFKEDNKGLNKSLYQLDVLYNTSSKLSGILDKNMLYEIMFETLEKTLSFDLACALVYSNKSTGNNKLFIHSLKKPDEALLNILKEKIVQHAKENNGCDTDFSNISTEEYIKPSYEHQNFDIKLLNSDKLTAPIKIKDKTFGVLLIYRTKPFLKEDVVCFQSIVHQISSALRAIVLYDEIKNTNVELKKLERIKSEFVSIVSHELRTPLAPITNSLDIVLSENVSETVKHFANMAKRNVSRLKGIIEDLLDLSRIETGKFDFKYAKYNIETSLDIIQKTFENQTKEKEIDFKISMPNGLPEIYADFKRIEQILGNLVTNAVKFTPKGGSIEIAVKTTSADLIDKNILIDPVQNPDGNYIQISVKDTGVGIKEEDIHKIFNKFSQIENSLTRNAGGIGLGLTLTKNFIDAHLGGIWVESKENEGSNFNVIIPVYSESKAFEIDLNAAKKINDTTCLLIFKTQSENPKETILALIQKLKNENIIKQMKNSKEAGFIDKDRFTYKIYFPNLQRNVCDFTVNQIQNFINNSFFKDCGIVLERAFYKKEEGDYSPGI